MILYNRTVAPASNPVSLSEAKAHCVVDFTDDDTLIGSLVTAATNAVEEMTGKALVSQTWTRESPNAYGKIAIEKRPLISVTGISYFDRDNAEQSADVADFFVYSDEDRAWIEPKPDNDWPDFYDRDDALKITFTVGYSTVPEELKQAILMLVSHWYENRNAASEKAMTEIPLGVEAMIGLHRKGWAA